MKQSGEMWILDDDDFFRCFFRRTQDQFEIGSLMLAVRYVNNKTTAIDAGAHYGSWSRYMSLMFDNVHAFEPHPKIFECLKKNIENYSNVKAYPAALSNVTSFVNIADGEENSGCNYVDGPGVIPSLVIDELDFDDVAFIKVDVEGYEYFVLRGAEKTLLKHKPIIHLEDKGHSLRYNIEQGEAVKYLESLGATVLTTYSNGLAEDYIMGWR